MKNTFTALVLIFAFFQISSAKAEESTSAPKCGSPQMERWFEYCIYSRPNCWELKPGGYCYGAQGWFGRCKQIRPPQRYCPNI